MVGWRTRADYIFQAWFPGTNATAKNLKRALSRGSLKLALIRNPNLSLRVREHVFDRHPAGEGEFVSFMVNFMKLGSRLDSDEKGLSPHFLSADEIDFLLRGVMYNENTADLYFESLPVRFDKARQEAVAADGKRDVQTPSETVDIRVAERIRIKLLLGSISKLDSNELSVFREHLVPLFDDREKQGFSVVRCGTHELLMEFQAFVGLWGAPCENLECRNRVDTCDESRRCPKCAAVFYCSPQCKDSDSERHALTVCGKEHRRKLSSVKLTESLYSMAVCQEMKWDLNSGESVHKSEDAAERRFTRALSGASDANTRS